MIALAYATAAVLSAQVTVTGSVQPLEVMRAVFGSELKRTALYQVVICNDGAEQIDFAGGQAVQVMASRVATIDGSLVPLAAARARKKSNLWRAAKTGEYLGLAGSVLIGAGAIAAPPAALVASTLVASVSERLTGTLHQEQAAATALLPKFLHAEEMFLLDPHRCISRLALGAYDKRISGFSAVLERGPASPAVNRPQGFVRPSWNRKDADPAAKHPENKP